MSSFVDFVNNGHKVPKESKERLVKWKKKFDYAENEYDIDEYDNFEAIYRGTKQTRANVNSNSNDRVKDTDNVVNLSFEIVESQVSTKVPDPMITSMRPGFERQAKMIQEKINSDVKVMQIQRFMDQNERNTYMHGIAHALVNWNVSKGSEDFKGEKELIQYHAKQVIPQPGIYENSDMEYLFLMGPTTVQAVWEEYGVNVEDVDYDYSEHSSIESRETETENPMTAEDVVTKLIAIYKDKDGDIGKFTWVGDYVLEDFPKYFYPRTLICRKCGAELPQGTVECPDCGHKKFDTNIVEEEVILTELHLSPIIYPEMVYEVVQDIVSGQPTVKPHVDYKVVERIVPAGTRVKIPVPKIFPLVSRINTPMNFKYRGQSDVSVTQDQQEAMKKIWSKTQEKLLLAPALVTVPQSLDIEITNDAIQLIKCDPQYMQFIQMKDLTPNVTPGVDFAMKNRDLAKEICGITPAFQGQYDPSAKSGKAKAMQIEQTAGRLASKLDNKNTFFAQLYRVMFFFDLVFTNEQRPYFAHDTYGDLQYQNFDKHELLMQSEDGTWFYNTDFLFEAGQSSEIPKDKMYLYEQTIRIFEQKGLDKKQLWEVLAEVKFPLANKLLEQSKLEQEDEETINVIIEVLARLPMEEREQLFMMPVEEILKYIEGLIEQIEKGGMENG